MKNLFLFLILGATTLLMGQDSLEVLEVEIQDSYKEIKLIPEMLNLLGCSKENFKKLIQKMNYKIIEKNEETFFKYYPSNDKRKASIKKTSKESPFGILKNLNLN